MTMLAITVGLLGWSMGRRGIEMLVLAGATAFPVPALVMVAMVALRAARAAGVGELRSPDAMFLVRIAADVRSGESIRSAISGAAEIDPRFRRAARLADAGRPMAEVAAELSSRLGRLGPEVAGSLRLSTAAGGSAAPALEELAAQVLELDDLDRERRAAMAPALLQAWILGGLAVVAVTWMAATGRLSAALGSGPLPATAVSLGLCSIVAGIAAVTWMVRR